MFTAEPVVRDEDGMWSHSALDDLEEEKPVDSLPAAEGMEFCYVSFDLDAPPELQKIYDTAMELEPEEDWRDAVKRWNPTPPPGNDWFLVAIYDTEDGPYACFGHPKPDTAN